MKLTFIILSAYMVCLSPIDIGAKAHRPANQLRKKYDRAAWYALHRAYAAKNYSQLKDSWECVSGYDILNKHILRPYEIQDKMRINLAVDSTMNLNGKTIFYRTAERDASFYETKSPFYPFLKEYLALRGINISQRIPVLLPDSCTDTSFPFRSFTDNGENLYTGNYLALYAPDCVSLYRHIRKSKQGLPDKSAVLLYTSADLYQDTYDRRPSARSKQWNIKETKAGYKLLDGNREPEDVEPLSWYIIGLPKYKQYPVIVCLNVSGDMDECLFFVVKGNNIDRENYISFLPYNDYSGETTEFAVFSDHTIYIRNLNKDDNGKMTEEFEVYRINDDGMFYELK
ncbi:hypothetical protein HMPREF0663_11838 [Hoylesella oralis ATCC 33269]|uniref:Uncharacterized protein n=1 Tax=Hoylesella oralis ATCC 33269 TaxID=873533 RepID=E7RRN7_9BACT|nr:hypothetical protein [Hoylesella oralis]EFZ36925.1 hypothetical protein HMPREF0663_11838 [Hoylesella oralis ATCC 33269]EPH18731.1 hypothetical protein HMPREF1475_00640 [Hoylesella oralis HGA0225]SHF76539.1 hypothetical protein SAMN05444288_1473 [Hoylesella oralis]